MSPPTVGAGLAGFGVGARGAATGAATGGGANADSEELSAPSTEDSANEPLSPPSTPRSCEAVVVFSNAAARPLANGGFVTLLVAGGVVAARSPLAGVEVLPGTGIDGDDVRAGGGVAIASPL